MLLQFVFLVIAGRELGPAEFGFYGYLLSILMVVGAVAQFGLPIVAVREFAQRPQEEEPLFAATFRIRGTLSVLFFLSAILIAALIPQPASHRLASWAMFLYLLFVPFDLSLLFDARKLSRWDVPGRTIGRAAALALLIILWKTKGTLSVFDAALASSVLMLVNVIIGWQMAKRLGVRLMPFAATKHVHELLRASLPVMWSNLMTVIYAQSQTALVKWLSTDIQTGYYALASRLMIPLLMLKGVLYRLLLPILSDVARDRAALNAGLERILPALALIFAPLAALAIPAAEVFVVAIFGAEYAGAIRPFQITVSYFFLTGMSSAFGVALLAAGDARTPTVGLTIGCAASIGLSFIWIPAYGAIGAAWAAWVAEIIANLYTLPKFLQLARPRVTRRLLGIAISSLAGTVVYYVLTIAAGAVTGLAFAIAALVILIGLWTTREISSARLRVVVEMVKRRGE